MGMGKVRQIEDKRSRVKRFYQHIKGWYPAHKDDVNNLQGLILIFVTTVLILTTLKSVAVTKDISNIEVYLASERAKDQLREKISLANDLLIELQRNKEMLTYTYSWEQMEPLKNKTETKPDGLKDDKIWQAKEMLDFGSDKFRSQINDYIDGIHRLKDDLSEIELAERQDDYNIKRERIDDFIKYSESFLSGRVNSANLNDMISETTQYINETEEQFRVIDSEMNEKIKELSSG